MPVILKMRDLDEIFNSIDPSVRVIINDLPNRTENDQSYFDYLIKQVYTSDMITMLPTCSCGDIRGEHRIGRLCPKCNTPVKQCIQDDIRPILWFRRPRGMERLINPMVMIMLGMRFKKRNFDPIRWLTDKHYQPTGAVTKVQSALMEAGAIRGYNSFVQNFEEIFQILNNHPDYKVKKKGPGFHGMLFPGDSDKKDPLEEMIKENRHILFSEYLPLPNRALIVLEKSFSKTYTEESSLGIHNALNTMRSIDMDFHDQKPSTIEARLGKILYMLTEYIKKYILTNLRPKPGIPRKHVYGTRGNHTFRAVITSHDRPADHDEIHIPWNAAIPLLELHIMSKLLRPDHPLGGMTFNEATAFILGHVEKYDPRMDAILKELIDESRHKALLFTIQRNPSQFKGSACTVRATKVKIDPGDSSVSMNDNIADFSNADFDGDEVNFNLMTDQYMEDMIYPLSPFFNMFELDEVLKVSGKVSMNSGVVASTSEWLTNQKRRAKKTLAA